jgi:hypothetical protein
MKPHYNSPWELISHIMNCARSLKEPSKLEAHEIINLAQDIENDAQNLLFHYQGHPIFSIKNRISTILMKLAEWIDPPNN